MFSWQMEIIPVPMVMIWGVLSWPRCATPGKKLRFGNYTYNLAMTLTPSFSFGITIPAGKICMRILLF